MNMKNYYKLIYNLTVDRRISVPALINRMFGKQKSFDNRLKSVLENHKYQEAIEIIEGNGVQESSENRKIYAYCLEAVGDSRSREIMKTYAEDKFGVTIDELICYIDNKLADSSLNIRYEYLGGLGNYGVFIAYRGEMPCLLIKILGDGVSDNEIEFYNKIYGEIAHRGFIPKFYNLFHFNDHLRFLVTEYVSPQRVDAECDKYAIKATQELSRIKQDRLFQLVPRRHLYKGNSEIGYLHKKIAVQMIREKINNTLLKDSSCVELQSELNRLFNLVIKAKLYKKIDPNTHYCLCHNDFHRKNMFKQNDNTVKVFDWNNYRSGLIGWDMAYYWGNFECSLIDIKNLYVKHQARTFINQNQSLIWELFFYLCLVYVWVARLHGVSANNYMDAYFRPAMQEIDEIIAKLA